MIGGGSRYCRDGISGSMAEAARRRQLQCGSFNGGNAAAVAVVVCQKR